MKIRAAIFCLSLALALSGCARFFNHPSIELRLIDKYTGRPIVDAAMYWRVYYLATVGFNNIYAGHSYLGAATSNAEGAATVFGATDVPMPATGSSKSSIALTIYHPDYEIKHIGSDEIDRRLATPNQGGIDYRAATREQSTIKLVPRVKSTQGDLEFLFKISIGLDELRMLNNTGGVAELNNHPLCGVHRKIMHDLGKRDVDAAKTAATRYGGECA